MSAPLFASALEISDFEMRLSTRAIGKRIHFLQLSQSTKDWALEAARSDGAHGSVFVTDAQTAGRGRRGRQWDCPPAQGLLFSVLLRPTSIPPEAAGWIPLAAGLACAEALAAISPALQGVSVKWPNDIVLPTEAEPGWKKLGGILCESALPALSSSATTADFDRGYAIIGIGLNINQSAEMLPRTDKAPPSSVRIETGHVGDRRAILQAILENLELHIDALTQSTQHPALQRAIENKMRAWMPASKKISFRTPPFDARSFIESSGTFAGLDPYGRIRLLTNAVETPHADIEITRVL